MYEPVACLTFVILIIVLGRAGQWSIEPTEII